MPDLHRKERLLREKDLDLTKVMDQSCPVEDHSKDIAQGEWNAQFSTGLKKALESDEDLHLTLLISRNTPVSGLPYSPAQLLVNWRLQDRLPMTERLLQPHIPADAHQLLVQHHQVVKIFYDWNSKELPPLWVKTSASSKKGSGSQQSSLLDTILPTHRHVMTQDGHLHCHNRKHLQKTCEPHLLVTPLPEEDQLSNHSTTIVHSQDPTEQLSLACLP